MIHKVKLFNLLMSFDIQLFYLPSVTASMSYIYNKDISLLHLFNSFQYYPRIWGRSVFNPRGKSVVLV